MSTRLLSYRVQVEGKTESERALGEFGRAGEASQKAVARGVEQTNQAVDRQMEKWRKLAATAREQQNAEERQAAFNRMLGVGGGSGKSAEESAAAFLGAANDPGKKGMSRNMRNTLIYTASDIVGSSANGIDPMRLGMQQGPQLLQAIAMESEGAAAKAVKLGLAFGGVAAAIGLTVAAGVAYEKAVNQMNVAAEGLGATAGLTGQQLNDLATNAAKVGGVSVSSARDMAASYVSTGRIGGDVLAGLIAVTRDYAALTGQDAKAATQDLGRAFADPARGAEDLNAKLHFLDDTTYRYIQTLVAHGETSKAQQVLLDAMGPKVLHAADNFDVLGGAVNRAKNFLVDMFNWYGRLAVRMSGGGLSLNEQLTKLQRQRDQLAPWAALGPAAKDRLNGLDRQIDAVEKQILAGWQAEGMAGLNQEAADARAVISKVIPQGRVDELRGQVAQLNKALKDGVLSPEGARDAQAALKKLNADISAMSAGYKSAEDQASKLKQRANESAAEARKAAQEAKKAADNQERLETLYFQNRLAIAKLRGLSGDAEDKGLEAEAQARLRVETLTKQYHEAGIAMAKARAMAERQVGEEIRAQSEGLARRLVEDVGYLKTLQETLAKGPVVYNENDKALQELKSTAVDAFDRITDTRNWKNWRDVGRAAIQDIIADLVKLSLFNPVKNWLFGTNEPTAKGGFWGDIIGAITGKVTGGGGNAGLMPGETAGMPDSIWAKIFGIGHNAQGTDNWRGGFTEVGEQGKETVWLPPGSKVFSNARSNAMRMGGGDLHVHVYAEGSVLTETVKDWVRAGVEEAVTRADANVPGAVSNHLSRRQIA